MTIRLLIKLSILFLLLAAGCGESISVDELRRTGEQSFVDQDYVKARQCFLKALNKEPSDRDLLYFAGMCYKRDFVYDSALIYLRRADILYPDDREINSQIYEVAIALEGAVVGRHIKPEQIFYVDISEKDARKLMEEEPSIGLSIDERDLLDKIFLIKRKEKKFWGM